MIHILCLLSRDLSLYIRWPLQRLSILHVYVENGVKRTRGDTKSYWKGNMRDERLPDNRCEIRTLINLRCVYLLKINYNLEISQYSFKFQSKFIIFFSCYYIEFSFREVSIQVRKWNRNEYLRSVVAFMLRQVILSLCK